MQEKIEFIRLVGDERRVGKTLAEVSRHWNEGREKFLFISPHDDDVVLGAGLFIQLAHREHVPIHVMIVTDGAMGYCSEEEKKGIVDIRRKETYDCYESLGIPRENIHWLGYPDCSLSVHQGRRAATPDDTTAIAGYTGLQNAFTYYLRKVGPSQCFLPTSNDLHPDHKVVHQELLISLFHASGGIWPELGTPLPRVPYVHEMGVYCDFPEPPQLRIMTPESILEKKLQAIAAFKSQKQISALIDNVRESGPQEYFREVRFQLYRPAVYHHRFDKKPHHQMLR
jgi:LmbE family N-acetylglucosaminyl deacetylase